MDEIRQREAAHIQMSNMQLAMEEVMRQSKVYLSPPHHHHHTETLLLHAAASHARSHPLLVHCYLLSSQEQPQITIIIFADIEQRAAGIGANRFAALEAIFAGEDEDDEDDDGMHALVFFSICFLFLLFLPPSNIITNCYCYYCTCCYHNVLIVTHFFFCFSFVHEKFLHLLF